MYSELMYVNGANNEHLWWLKNDVIKKITNHWPGLCLIGFHVNSAIA